MEVQIQSLLTSVVDGDACSDSRPGLMIPGDRSHARRLKLFGKQNNVLPLSVFKPRTFQPVTNSMCSFNPLTPNDHCSGRTALLTSKHCILYIYSTNIGTEYFKHGIYSPFFFLQNAVCFIILTYLVPLLFTFYIKGVLKLKKIISVPKG